MSPENITKGFPGAFCAFSTGLCWHHFAPGEHIWSCLGENVISSLVAFMNIHFWEMSLKSSHFYFFQGEIRDIGRCKGGDVAGASLMRRHWGSWACWTGEGWEEPLSMYTNIWRWWGQTLLSGAQPQDKGQGSWRGTQHIPSEYEEKFLWGDRLEQDRWRDCGAPPHKIFQTHLCHLLGGDPAWAGGWTRWSPEAPPNPNNSLIFIWYNTDLLIWKHQKRHCRRPLRISSRISFASHQHLH